MLTYCTRCGHYTQVLPYYLCCPPCYEAWMGSLKEAS